MLLDATRFDPNSCRCVRACARAALRQGRCGWRRYFDICIVLLSYAGRPSRVLHVCIIQYFVVFCIVFCIMYCPTLVCMYSRAAERREAKFGFWALWVRFCPLRVGPRSDFGALARCLTGFWHPPDTSRFQILQARPRPGQILNLGGLVPWSLS